MTRNTDDLPSELDLDNLISTDNWNMIVAIQESASSELSLGTIVVIVLPAAIALLGVLASNLWSSISSQRAEERRAKNSVSAQVLEEARRAELEALYAVAEMIAAVKDFNRTMSGNSGEGEDDERSAAAFQRFAHAFDGFDSLAQASITVRALGSLEVADRILAIRQKTLDYMMSLEPPVFRAAVANTFEEAVDSMIEVLIAAVRSDFGTEEARASRPGHGIRIGRQTV